MPDRTVRTPTTMSAQSTNRSPRCHIVVVTRVNAPAFVHRKYDRYVTVLVAT